ncbi:hypothetical protein [Thiolapillus sp.]
MSLVLVPLEHGVNTALCLSSVRSHLPVIAAAFVRLQPGSWATSISRN